MQFELSLIPEQRKSFETFIQTLETSLGSHLRSLVLFGSAAENRLRFHSDINMLAILNSLEGANLEPVRSAYPLAKAELRAQLTIVLVTELPLAAQVFPIKYLDIKSRYKILLGEDLILPLAISSENLTQAIKQSLLNLSLRLREKWLAASHKDDLLLRGIAEAAGSLRAVANAILHLRGTSAPTPREALEILLKASGDPEFSSLSGALSAARERQELPNMKPSQSLELLCRFVDSLLQQMHK